MSVKPSIPPYGNRGGWIPRRPEDFGDSGAFPEIKALQYPLNMGKGMSGKTAGTAAPSNALAIQLDATGHVKFDEIARQGTHYKGKIIYAKFTDLLPKQITEEDPDLARPDAETVAEVTERTRKTLEAMVSSKVAAAMPVKGADKLAPVQYIRYTPATQGGEFNSGANQRIIRMCEVQKDPMEPPRFKVNKKIPKGPPSPPAPVLHSPTRKVTVKEQQDWKIPPCISNWKNPKGYTIPLDKRLAADGRGLQSVHINDNFSKFAESLYIADRKAREAIEMRAKVEQTIAQKEKTKKEEDLKMLANQVREQRSGIKPSVKEDKDVQEREDIRRDRQRDRNRERAINRAAPEKRSQLQKDKERDISEKIALGLPNTGQNSGETQFDSRLFNSSKGMDSGFSHDDEGYNVYDKPWRETESITQAIYRPTKNADNNYGDDLDTEIQKNKKGFAKEKPDKPMERTGPVAFEQHQDTNFDPFQIDDFLGNLKTGGGGLSSSGNSSSNNKRPNEAHSSSSNRDSDNKKKRK